MHQTRMEINLSCPLKVLIADDHFPTRVGIREIFKGCFGNLTDQDFVEASTVDETIKAAHSVFEQIKGKGSSGANSVLVVLDILFANEKVSATEKRVKTGLTAAEKIWDLHPSARILIVSQSVQEKYINEIYELKSKARGAWGWIPKDKLSAERVQFAVNCVLNGHNCIDEDIRDVRDSATDAARYGQALSSDEIETILYAGVGLTDDAIGANFETRGQRSKFGILTDRAIQARLSNVYTKLGIKKLGENNSDETASIFNERCRAIWECLRRGIVTLEDFTLKEEDLKPGGERRTRIEEKINEIKQDRKTSRSGKDKTRDEKIK